MTSRRFFIKKATAISLFSYLQMTPSFTNAQKTGVAISRPKRLSTGDTVGLISPSGAIYESEPYEIAKEALANLGLKVKQSKHLYGRYGHLAGSDEERAQDLNDMFRDEEVKAIFCLRGGSGAARILDLVDYKMIAKSPKIFIGYSDVTALLLAIYAKSGLVTFHGPLGVSDWNDFTLKYLRAILFDGEATLLRNPPKPEDAFVQRDHRIRTITPGQSTGPLVGGNLSVLSALVGTGYLPDFKGKILFLEDVGEKVYRVDRMMSQLKLSGILEKVSGFVLGKCTDCDAAGGYGSLTLEEIIDHYIKPLKVPAYAGAMIGHIDKNFTLPIGVSATIDAGLGTIQLEEPAVQ